MKMCNGYGIFNHVKIVYESDKCPLCEELRKQGIKGFSDYRRKCDHNHEKVYFHAEKCPCCAVMASWTKETLGQGEVMEILFTNLEQSIIKPAIEWIGFYYDRRNRPFKPGDRVRIRKESKWIIG